VRILRVVYELAGEPLLPGERLCQLGRERLDAGGEGRARFPPHAEFVLGGLDYSVGPSYERRMSPGPSASFDSSAGFSSFLSSLPFAFGFGVAFVFGFAFGSGSMDSIRSANTV
jgi:hypothetical protein